MSIQTETVKNVAKLARLHISEAEEGVYAEQLSRILELMEKLNHLPTEGTEPMSHPIVMNIPEREDCAQNSNQQRALLACAPDSEQGYFRVPKIIE